MCGIIGIISYNDNATKYKSNLNDAVARLRNRGPDSFGTFYNNNIGLGHTRLSIIDPSLSASQPMTDNSDRFTIVYNGEIYNFRALRKSLEEKGITFNSNSDTEVLLNLYINERENCLQKINGFFAFAIYDKVEESLFIARDRMGIKPLLFYQDKDIFLFGSEMKALLAFNIDKTMDYTTLYQYIQLSYCPPGTTIFKYVKPLLPGEYLFIKNKEIKHKPYYNIPYGNVNQGNNENDYDCQKKNLEQLLDKSVKDRLAADVPVGAFLSGGIDSSIIVALASRHISKLNTFTIGYSDEPFFDETKYANLAAKKFNTNHTMFSLSNEDLYESLHDILESVDHPFADPSLPAVQILSKKVSKYVKVALSGDGGDELFAGYNKHEALYKSIYGAPLNNIIKSMKPIWDVLPKSRGNYISNKIRQLHKFADGLSLPYKERYWRWCSYYNEDLSLNLLSDNVMSYFDNKEYNRRKSNILHCLDNGNGFDDILFLDMNLVLSGDMLPKVDSMSMVNSLEVRVPLLDHNVVEYAFSLPIQSKIDRSRRKKILKDTFMHLLPVEMLNRPKHGFDVPLLRWFQGDLKSLIKDDLLAEDFIADQRIFSVGAINNLKKQLFSNRAGDIQTLVWTLLIFQYWWKKWMGN